MAIKLKVTLVRSGINRPEPQKQTIRQLGLRKLHRSVVLPDNLAVRGMIRSVSHLVKVEAAE
jgi:large subunit ribosomal protein L30